MSQHGWRSRLKFVLGQLPLLPELYQRYSGPAPYYGLPLLADRLPDWVGAVRRARRSFADRNSKRVLIFAYLPWWLEHAVALGLLIRSRGHDVQLAYLPHRGWQRRSGRFDDRRQSAYIQSALRALSGEIELVPIRPGGQLDPALDASMERQSWLDVQYTLQREDLDVERDPEVRSLLELRRTRNRSTSAGVHKLLSSGHYDSLIVPNGSILEFGAVHRTARHLGQRTVSYEFGEQRERAWLAQDVPVMQLPMDGLWQAVGGEPATRAQLEKLSELYAARKGGQRWSHFVREWQSAGRKGEAEVRRCLDLSPDLPVVLLCTNVVGDSLALDRQLFTEGMVGWLTETLRAFAERNDVQLVVRVHPGELLGAGHRSQEVIAQALPQLPPQVKVVPPDSKLNTYDLIDLAHLGLVYSSTVGLEMAMNGVPVVVSGATHYRGKGFTYDPETLQDYRDTLERLLGEPNGRRLPKDQIELAWRYAYLFFFRFPFLYPWHLIGFWQDLEERPLEIVVQPNWSAKLDRTLAAFTGQPINWLPEPESAAELEPA